VTERDYSDYVSIYISCRRTYLHREAALLRSHLILRARDAPKLNARKFHV